MMRKTAAFLSVVEIDIGKARVYVWEFLGIDPLFEEFVAWRVLEPCLISLIPSPWYDQVKHGHILKCIHDVQCAHLRDASPAFL